MKGELALDGAVPLHICKTSVTAAVILQRTFDPPSPAISQGCVLPSAGVQPPLATQWLHLTKQGSNSWGRDDLEAGGTDLHPSDGWKPAGKCLALPWLHRGVGWVKISMADAWMAWCLNKEGSDTEQCRDGRERSWSLALSSPVAWNYRIIIE